MKKLIITVCLLSVFLIPKQSHALSCIEPPPANIAFERYDAVIIGTVQDIERKNNSLLLTLEVEKSYKGVEDKIIKVYEDVFWGTSVEGTKYLFYLNKEEGKWIHPLCSPTTTKVENEFFTNKIELDLKEEKVTEEKPQYASIIFLLVAGFAVLFVVIFTKKR